MADAETTQAPSYDGRVDELHSGMYAKFLGYGTEPGDEEPRLEEGEVLYLSVWDAENGAEAASFRLNENGQYITAVVYEMEIGPVTDEDIEAARKQYGRDPSNAVVNTEEAPAETSETPEDTTPEETEEAVAEEAPKASSGKGKAKSGKAKSTKGKAKTSAEPADTAVATTSSSDDDHRQIVIGTQSQSVSTILELGGDEILEAAKQLNEQAEKTYFTLGGVLANIYATGLHKSKGYDGKRSFARYVQAELGMEYRKAMYLMSIYEAFSKLGIPEERLEEIGWSKAKELVKVEDPDKLEALMEYAKTHTKNELIEHVKSETVDAGDGSQSTRMKVKKFNFTVSETAGENIQAALDAATNQCGSDSPNAAFEFIVGEWRSMQEGIDIPVEEAIQLLEAKYGVKLSVEQAQDSEDATEEVEQATASAVQ